MLDLYVSPSTVADSVHGTSNPQGALGCTDCHGENVFPHNGPSPESARAYRVRASQTCTNCHNELLADSAHLEQIAAGNLNAATCVDCHGAHQTPPIEEQQTLAAAVCSTCHTNTFDEWAQSPHSEMSSLGCAVCHLPHGQQLRIENTNQLCLNCHKVPQEIWVHNKHLGSEFKVTCANCHMSVNPDIQLAAADLESPDLGTELTEAPDTSNTDTTTDTVEMTPIDHTMIVNALSCSECHAKLDKAGIWAQLVDTDQSLVIERNSLRQQVVELEGRVSSDSESDKDKTSYVQLIQGLIVGVGVGVVVLLIVVSRLRSGKEVNTDNGDE